tara:strand:- start:385 stop:1038 length:654 start_codon:yes stop_codon:yes gene_type:complete
MLVYHFKDRLYVLEQKCDTMFEIMNSLIKEMKNIKQVSLTPSIPQHPLNHTIPQGFHTPELEESDEEEYDDSVSDSSTEDMTQNEEKNEMFPVVDFKKIIVEDIVEDVIDDEPIVEKLEEVSKPLEIQESYESLEEIKELSEIDDLEVEDDSIEDESVEETTEQPEKKDEMIKLQYKKLDISVLRAMVTSRGLSEDAKKTKKADLVKLLEAADSETQ